MMGVGVISPEVMEVAKESFAECQLGKMTEGKVFDKPMSEYDKPLGLLYGDSDIVEKVEISGGRYADVRKHVQESGELNKEVHHIPADSVSPLERNDGPAIEMETADHRQTASWGNSLEAQEYRAQQRELIDKGDFRGAVEMDIDDIREKFGDKYDSQLSKALDYVAKIEGEGKI